MYTSSDIVKQPVDKFLIEEVPLTEKDRELIKSCDAANYRVVAVCCATPESNPDDIHIGKWIETMMDINYEHSAFPKIWDIARKLSIAKNGFYHNVSIIENSGLTEDVYYTRENGKWYVHRLKEHCIKSVRETSKKYAI